MKRTDVEAIEDLMALRVRLEDEARIIRARLGPGGDTGILRAVVRQIQIAEQMKARLKDWHKKVKRRKPR